MKINVESSKLTDAPYTKETANAFVFEDDGQFEQLKLELENAVPGSYLISGYRGSGKTSFINRLKSEVSGFLIVDLNIAQKYEYPVLIKKIIRQLYLSYSALDTGRKSKLTKDFEDELKLLYDRTFNDIVHSQLINAKEEHKSERKLQYDFKKLIPYIFALFSALCVTFFSGLLWFPYLTLVGSIVWAGVADFSQTWTRTKTGSANVELSRKSLYDNEIAEYHLFTVLQELHEKKVKILLVFDELDKLPDDGQIKEVINDLKPLLLSGYASSLVVAGQSLFYELEKSTYLDDLVISTLFSRSIHVAFLKNAALKKFCIGLISDDSNKSDPLVNEYFDSLILHSGRIPRKLVNLIRSSMVWEDKQATIMIDENKSKTLKWKSDILRAVTYAIDNQLADQSKNTVQLDFFTAQVFIWIGKMIQYTSIPFKQIDIFTLKDYDEHYPSTYISELVVIWHALLDQLSEEKLLKITEEGDPEAANDTYSWIILPEKEMMATENFVENQSDVENPATEQQLFDDDGADGFAADEINYKAQIKQSLFLTDFAELEAYIRHLYLEIDENAVHGNFSFRKLIEKMVEIGVLKKGYENSSKIKRLNDTRNKIAHGQAIGTDDLDEVRSSAMNMGRIRAEINEDFTFFVIKNYLQGADIEKSSKGGFDFIALTDHYLMAFEVKSAQKDKLSVGDVAEFIDKYSNFVVTTKFPFEGSNFIGTFSYPLKYLIFFFQPPGRKSMDDFFINFKSIVKEKLPKYAKNFHLSYVSFTNTNSRIRKQIEDTVQVVLDQVNNEMLS